MTNLRARNYEWLFNMNERLEMLSNTVKLHKLG